MQHQQTELTELKVQLAAQREQQATELAHLKEQLELVKAMLSRSDDTKRATLELEE